MRHRAVLGLSLAASLVLLVPEIVTARSTQSAKPSQTTSNDAAGSAEASAMVPAQAVLHESLDARKAKVGDQISATLSEKVQLKNGPELPSGTLLEGKVATDDMQQKGTSKLALSLDHAQLKDGKTVPIKTTIIGIYQPSEGTPGYEGMVPGQPADSSWNKNIHAVDQIDALPNVDLHSSITSMNSGVLVSTRKDDIKLGRGTQLALAIAPQQPGLQGKNQGSSH